MTKLARLSLLSLLLALVLTPALARKAKDDAAEPGRFTLQSELMARDPAVKEALDAAEAKPSDAALWNALGRILTEKGDHADAVSAFDRALAIDPESNAYLSNKGATLLRQGNSKEALKLLQQALEIEPFDGVAYYNLGLAHDRLGHYDEALAAFKSAFLIEPSLRDPDRNPAVVNNEHILAIDLEVYLETAGATPSVFQDAIDNP